MQLGADRPGRDAGPKATLIITLRERNREGAEDVRGDRPSGRSPETRGDRAIRDARRLKVGQWRELTAAEVQKLRAATKSQIRSSLLRPLLTTRCAAR